MGKKNRPFKLKVDFLNTKRNRGTITREQLVRIVSDSCTGGVDPAVAEELHLFAQTTDKVGFGYWSGQTVEGEPCGCPMASISDWVDPNEFNDHPGKYIGSVHRGLFIGKFDGAMSKLFNGAPSGYVTVTD